MARQFPPEWYAHQAARKTNKDRVAAKNKWESYSIGMKARYSALVKGAYRTGKDKFINGVKYIIREDLSLKGKGVEQFIQLAKQY